MQTHAGRRIIRGSLNCWKAGQSALGRGRHWGSSGRARRRNPSKVLWQGRVPLINSAQPHVPGCVPDSRLRDRGDSTWLRRHTPPCWLGALRRRIRSLQLPWRQVPDSLHQQHPGREVIPPKEIRMLPGKGSRSQANILYTFLPCDVWLFQYRKIGLHGLEENKCFHDFNIHGFEKFFPLESSSLIINFM